MSASLGERLAIFREAKGMTLRDVEKASGISNAYVSQLETGKVKDPSLTKLKALAKAYGVTVSKLIGEEL